MLSAPLSSGKLGLVFISSKSLVHEDVKKPNINTIVKNCLLMFE